MDAKTLALVATLALAISGSMMSMNSNDSVNKFEAFSAQYGKVYDSEAEKSYRFAVYTANMAEIESHNAGQSTYTKGQNQFTDITDDEFRQTYLMKVAPERSDAPEIISSEPVGSVNWVTQGAVQKVKDQGQCGSCWAFSAAAVAESYDFIQKGSLGNFSEQQLVSCSSQNSGCNGGMPYKALDYYASNGICTESSYPYTSGGGSTASCRQSSCTKSSYKISGHSSIGQSVSSMQSANDKSPVSICVDANNWSSYSGGIFSNCGTSMDHAVLLAGYTSSYWLVKNSWGTSWGESGYIRLKGNANTCAILNYGTIPR